MKRTASLLLVTLTLQLTAGPLLAQAAPGKNIGEVTLFGEDQPKVEAATKTEIPISKAPASVTVITAKQIGESGARTIPEILRLVGGVNVRWNPMVATIDIRGFGENPFSSRVLILVDGAPFNSGDTGGFPLSPAFDLFPIQMIKRIEVVRGPGSSLYGENAYWGVINIVTLSGEDLAGGSAQLFGGGVRDTATGTVMYGNRFGQSGTALAGIKVIKSQFPTEFWMDDKSKFRASEIFLKGVYKDLQAELYRHDDRLDGFSESFPTPPFPPGSAFTSAHNIKQTMDVVAFRYNHAPAGAKVTYAADLSWAHRFGMHCAGCHAAQENPEHFTQPENHGYQAIGDFRLGIKMIPGHDVLLGAELRRLDRGDHKRELSPAGTIVSGYDKSALYAQDQFEVIRDRLRATVGVRLDRKTDITPSKTSPRLALVYTPNDRLVLRGNYSTAFRFPTFSELYQATWFISASGPLATFPLAVFNPNPNLKPEEIRTIEAGGEYQITPTFSGRVDLYRSHVSKFIVITEPDLGNGLVGLGWENHPATGNITGGEAELRANFTRGITGFANWAHQTASQSGSAVDSSGRRIEFVYAPKDKFNLGAYAGPFNGWRGSVELAWRGSYVGPQFQYLLRSNFTDPVVHPLPSYTLINARLGYDLNAFGTNRPIRLSLIGQNLLNKKPEETLLGVPGAIVGREVFGQIEVHF
jgi:outer membrane receptor for ferrienterochelin and colicins